MLLVTFFISMFGKSRFLSYKGNSYQLDAGCTLILSKGFNKHSLNNINNLYFRWSIEVSIKIQNKRRNSKLSMKEPRWMTTKRIKLTKGREQESPENRDNSSVRFVVLQILGRGAVLRVSTYAGQGRVQGVYPEEKVVRETLHRLSWRISRPHQR